MRYQIVENQQGSYRLRVASNNCETTWCKTIARAIRSSLIGRETTLGFVIVYEFDSIEQFKEDYPEELI